MTELFVIDMSSAASMRKSLRTLAERIAEEDDPAPPAAVFDPPVSCVVTPLPLSSQVADDPPATPVLRLAATPGLRRWRWLRGRPDAEMALNKAILRAWNAEQWLLDALNLGIDLHDDGPEEEYYGGYTPPPPPPPRLVLS
jgi:hypothetical protein